MLNFSVALLHTSKPNAGVAYASNRDRDTYGPICFDEWTITEVSTCKNRNTSKYTEKEVSTYKNEVSTYKRTKMKLVPTKGQKGS
jgi:hypothetical protein